MRLLVCSLAMLCFLSGCATSASDRTLYQAMGGRPVVEQIVDNFIVEIGYDQSTFAFFQDSNINRFQEKMFEHICYVADGPCEYTGDSMIEVHTNMHISEAQFNGVVDLLINAMDKAEVPHRLQNRFIKRLVPMREDIIYR